jgi:hypothetical protein
MFRYEVDPAWYESFWYADRARQKHRSRVGRVAWLAMLVGLLTGTLALFALA